MVWCCQPVALAICSTVAPSGRRSSSERLEPAEHRVDLAFRCTKAARASSFDLVFVLLVLAIILSSVSGCRSDECFF